MSNWFHNHQPQKTQISSGTNVTFIQNSNRMAFSVDRNHKFSEHILSTPTVFKTTTKLFSSQGCSDDKNCLDFVDYAVQFCFCCKLSFYWKPWIKFDNGMIFLDQSEFFAPYSNQWDCFIFYRQQTSSVIYYWTDEWQQGIYLSNR